MFLRTGRAPRDSRDTCKHSLIAKEAGKFSGQLCLVLEVALPNNERAPTQLPEPAPIRTVALAIPLEFRNPVLLPSARYPSFYATRVLMPEAAVNKDDLVTRRKNDVGFPR